MFGPPVVIGRTDSICNPAEFSGIEAERAMPEVASEARSVAVVGVDFVRRRANFPYRTAQPDPRRRAAVHPGRRTAGGPERHVDRGARDAGALSLAGSLLGAAGHARRRDGEAAVRHVYRSGHSRLVLVDGTR